MNTIDQKSDLDRHYDTYRRDSRQDTIMRELVVRTFSPYLDSTASGLELGCSDGYMTEMLSSKLTHLTVVEGSYKFIEDAKTRGLVNVQFHHSLIDEYMPEQLFDYVFASYILTHIPDVGSVLEMIKRALTPEGLLFVVVPNVRALSRQLALNMGLIEDLKALSRNDRDHGHRSAGLG